MVTLVVVFGILAVVFMALGFKGVIFQFTEPKNFNEEVFDGLDKGDYVKLELNMCFGSLGDYITTYDTGSTSVTGGLYLFAVSDENFENFIYVPVKLSSKDAELAEQITEQTDKAWNSILGKYVEDNLTKSLEIKGVLKELDDSTDYNEKGLYNEVVKEWDLYDEEIVDYKVETELLTIPRLVSFAFGLLFLVGIVITVLVYSSAFPTKKLKAYVAKNGLTGREVMLCSEFEQAKKISKRIYAGRNYCFFSAGFKVKMFAYSDIVWAYVDVIRVKNSVTYKLNLIMRDKSKEKVASGVKSEIDEICETILSVNPGILLGNDKKNADMFRNNFDELVRMVDEIRTQGEAGVEESYQGYDQ